MRRDSPEGASAVLAAYLERRADLVRFFALRLRSASAAEDLVQDIYLRLVAIDAGTQVHNPVGYLYRLGSNLMLDSLRGQHRTAARDASWRDTHSTFVGAEEVAEQPDAEQAIAARQRLDAVVVALRDLPEQTQRVFRMHKFDGLSHPEVAQRLGISRSGVEKHVMAALKHLSARLR